MYFSAHKTTNNCSSRSSRVSVILCAMEPEALEQGRYDSCSITKMENQTHVAMPVDGTDAPGIEFTSLAVRLRWQADLGLWLVPQAQLSISCAGPGEAAAAAAKSGSCKIRQLQNPAVAKSGSRKIRQLQNPAAANCPANPNLSSKIEHCKTQSSSCKLQLRARVYGPFSAPLSVK